MGVGVGVCVWGGVLFMCTCFMNIRIGNTNVLFSIFVVA